MVVPDSNATPDTRRSHFTDAEYTWPQAQAIYTFRYVQPQTFLQVPHTFVEALTEM